MFSHGSLFQFTLENHNKVGESFQMSERNLYISSSTCRIFSLGLIRGAENSGLFSCVQRIGSCSAYFLISSGTCGKPMYAVWKNCSQTKNIEIKSENIKSNVLASTFNTFNPK